MLGVAKYMVSEVYFNIIILHALRQIKLDTLTTVGSNTDRDFGFFHVRKLSS
jgi:hypothetical protein